MLSTPARVEAINTRGNEGENEWQGAEKQGAVLMGLGGLGWGFAGQEEARAEGFTIIIQEREHCNESNGR